MTEAMQQVIRQLFDFALKNGLKEVTIHIFGEDKKVKVSEYKRLFKETH